MTFTGSNMTFTGNEQTKTRFPFSAMLFAVKSKLKQQSIDIWSDQSSDTGELLDEVIRGALLEAVDNAADGSYYEKEVTAASYLKEFKSEVDAIYAKISSSVSRSAFDSIAKIEDFDLRRAALCQLVDRAREHDDFPLDGHAPVDTPMRQYLFFAIDHACKSTELNEDRSSALDMFRSEMLSAANVFRIASESLATEAEQAKSSIIDRQKQ